jgi:hypothetical protein
MKTYVLTLSKNFQASHPNAGQATNFGIEFIDREEFYSSNGGIHKIHTIRANYPFWEKRFEDIERGDAYATQIYADLIDKKKREAAETIKIMED